MNRNPNLWMTLTFPLITGAIVVATGFPASADATCGNGFTYDATNDQCDYGTDTPVPSSTPTQATATASPAATIFSAPADPYVYQDLPKAAYAVGQAIVDIANTTDAATPSPPPVVIRHATVRTPAAVIRHATVKHYAATKVMKRLAKVTPAPRPAPRAKVTPAPRPAPRAKVYTIKRGDTLTGIARRHGTTVRILATLNHIKNVNLIYWGMEMRIR